MIRYCKIKHCIIGFDRPKICVPLVGRSEEEIIAQADQIRQSQRSSAIDMVELRGDYLDILPDYEVLDRLLAKVAEILPEKAIRLRSNISSSPMTNNTIFLSLNTFSPS